MTPSELRMPPGTTPTEQPKYVSATSPAAIANGVTNEDLTEVTWTEGEQG